jgi:hypothetical protein
VVTFFGSSVASGVSFDGQRREHLQKEENGEEALWMTESSELKAMGRGHFLHRFQTMDRSG